MFLRLFWESCSDVLSYGPMELRTERMTRLATKIGAATAMAMMFLALGAVRSEADAGPEGVNAETAGKDRSPQQPQVKLGLVIDDPKAFQGYTLLAPMGSPKTYLIDMKGRVVRTWESDSCPALSAYLLGDGHLLRPAGLRDQPFGVGPGAGGRIQEFTWDGALVWDYKLANEKQISHHDIAKLPNGNVLMIVREKKTAEEAIIAGRKPEPVGGRPLQLDGIIEVKPTGKTTGDVVWEWHLWDHLIQDHDSSKANYGDVAAHPELVDINYIGDSPMAALVATKDGLDKLKSIGYLGGSPSSKTPPQVDPHWTYINSVDYNAGLDQVALSVRGFSEVWIIDHSTTTAEAAGHTGGRSGRGGDLLYRWGNPRAYRAGTAADQKLFHQHNAHWIAQGRPGEGHLLVFNNGMRRPGGEYSSVEELVLPVDAEGRYARAGGAPFGPDRPVWSYAAPKKSDFYSAVISGAQRLPNGDTLICSGGNGTLFEVTADGDVVWKYVNPVKPTMGPGGPGGPPRLGNILPPFLRDLMNLSPQQWKDLDAFQKEVADRLDKVLTDEQRKQLTARRGFGPGGPRGFAPPGQLMALSTQITLKLTPEQKAQIQGLQKQIDGPLDTLLTDTQKAQLEQVKRMWDDFARVGPPGSGPGGPSRGGPSGFGGPPGGGAVFRAYRYGPDYPGLSGKDLTPGKTVDELQPREPEAR